MRRVQLRADTPLEIIEGYNVLQAAMDELAVAMETINKAAADGESKAQAVERQYGIYDLVPASHFVKAPPVKTGTFAEVQQTARELLRALYGDVELRIDDEFAQRVGSAKVDFWIRAAAIKEDELLAEFARYIRANHPYLQQLNFRRLIAVLEFDGLSMSQRGELEDRWHGRISIKNAKAGDWYLTERTKED